jgi:predicted flap endonuclease-1-like 5' DNA nuclease
MVSLFSFLPEYPAEKVEPETAPRVAVGAASPLWLMFGGAAAAGAAYWWWASRWREAVNLEALMALAPEPVAPPVEPEAVLEAAEPVVEAMTETIEVAEVVAETAPAPIEAVVAVAAEPDEALAVTDEVLAQPSEALEASEAPPVAVEALIAEPTAEAEAEVETVEAVEAIESVGDDLTRLVGIGPKLAASLAELGVTRFSQIAAWTPDELASIDQLLGLKGRAERDAWVAQAKRFVEPAQA